MWLETIQNGLKIFKNNQKLIQLQIWDFGVEMANLGSKTLFLYVSNTSKVNYPSPVDT